MTWDAPPPAVVFGRVVANDARVLEAEAALARNEFAAALEALAGLPAEPGCYSRTLLLQALKGHGDLDLLVETFSPPSNVEELVEAALARLSLRGESDALNFFDAAVSDLGVPPPQAQDLRRAIITRARLQ